MEGFKGGLKGYWKRRAYHRIDGSGPAGQRPRIGRAELGGGRRRSWRIKVGPRLKFLRRLASPTRILARIRDAYVRMMLGFANSRVFAGGYGFAGAEMIGFGQPQLKEYDDKMLVEIYKTIIAQRNLIAAGDGGGDGRIELQP